MWWFGGGFDLTPYYPVREDVLHWHRTAREACAGIPGGYAQYKAWCDRYFFLPHRNETRGVGGLFFDDLERAVLRRPASRSRAPSATPSRKPGCRSRSGGAATPFGERERAFQLLRRGRYVEFNLVYDRGTLFGLQTGGRTESILMSLPPLVRWEYGWTPEAGFGGGRARARLAAPARLARRGVKYRHAFHAGNFADVMKHVALVAALLRLTEKDRPLFLLDTHAGRGRYELAARGRRGRAAASRRARGRGPARTHPALARYLEIVRGMNPTAALRTYPGSPLIEAAFMRPGDRAAFCELQDRRSRGACAGNSAATRAIGVHCRDGFEALGALLPPPEKRGLALIDPPYEEHGRGFRARRRGARWPRRRAGRRAC